MNPKDLRSFYEQKEWAIALPGRRDYSGVCSGHDGHAGSGISWPQPQHGEPLLRVFRSWIATHQAEQKALLAGTVEVDESYFGPSRPRGVTGKLKRGRRTMKQKVFDIIERGGRVCTEVVPAANMTILQRIIRGKAALDATVISDGWKGYDGLVEIGYDRHLRIKKSLWSPSKLSLNGVYINGIESFWSFTKRGLAKFNGVTKNFELHLKECE